MSSYWEIRVKDTSYRQRALSGPYFRGEGGGGSGEWGRSDYFALLIREAHPDFGGLTTCHHTVAGSALSSVPARLFAAHDTVTRTTGSDSGFLYTYVRAPTRDVAFEYRWWVIQRPDVVESFVRLF